MALKHRAEKTDWLNTPLAVWLSLMLLTAGVFAAYRNSLGGPFVFDDGPSIAQNQSIRRFATALTPPHAVGETVAGRPVLNLSFALNYAAGGLDVRGYHWTNLFIHLAAGLLLFGLVRRTLLCPLLRPDWGTQALPLALSVASVWLLHPLQTESVTYVVQRAESLAGMFCLLTMYAFARSVESKRAAGWQGLAVVSCLLGMGTKETVAAAPLLVLLFDRTFVSGTFAAAWRSRRGCYVGLGLTWLWLGWLIVQAGGRGTTAGLNTEITAATYALTQCRAVILYLQLAIWPAPLVFDYGTEVVTRLAAVWPHALLLLALGVGTIAALRSQRAFGFLGVWFLALLAPSSSFVPVATQTMAEHRMYLPLAALVAGGVLGLLALLGRKSFAVCLLVAAAGGFLTAKRNEDYRSEAAIWRDTATKLPANARAHSNLGVVLLESGAVIDAIREYEAALRLQPGFSEAHSNLGAAYARLGRIDDAITEFREALRLRPDAFDANYNLATILTQRGEVAGALPLFATALRVHAEDGRLQNNFGNALFVSGRFAAAAEHYALAVRFDPANAEAHNNLAAALVRLNRLTEARAQYGEALRLRPDYATAQTGLNLVIELEKSAARR